ncbi:MAG: LemA family protein [Bacteriovoracia bacterium]
MSKMTKVLIGIAGIFLISIVWVVSVNNSLVRKEETVTSSWSQVENVYQRRMDLIPNLVNTVKGYAKHEKETLENVIRARNTAIQAQSSGLPSAVQKTQDGLSSALSRLMVVVEKYPDLKANENFRDLQSQLEGTENRIAVERRRFNEVVQDYNSSLKVFPQSMIASFRGFKPKDYFQAKAGAEEAPKVEF